jgi:hypothetical protein
MLVYGETLQDVEVNAPSQTGIGPNGVVVRVLLCVLVPFVVQYACSDDIC